MPFKQPKPTAGGRGRYKAISDATYDKWKDIVFLMYFKMNYSQKLILEWFAGALSENVLKEVANRYRYENPDCYYAKRKSFTHKNASIQEAELRYKQHLKEQNND